jgi:hypothetical protein
MTAEHAMAAKRLKICGLRRRCSRARANGSVQLDSIGPEAAAHRTDASSDRRTRSRGCRIASAA